MHFSKMIQLSMAVAAVLVGALTACSKQEQRSANEPVFTNFPTAEVLIVSPDQITQYSPLTREELKKMRKTASEVYRRFYDARDEVNACLKEAENEQTITSVTSSPLQRVRLTCKNSKIPHLQVEVEQWGAELRTKWGFVDGAYKVQVSEGRGRSVTAAIGEGKKIENIMMSLTGDLKLKSIAYHDGEHIRLLGWDEKTGDLRQAGKMALPKEREVAKK